MYTNNPNSKVCPDLLADYASKQNLAAAFDRSERTIDRWVRMRLLPPPVRLGRTSLFHIPTVQEHLARNLPNLDLPRRGRK